MSRLLLTKYFYWILFLLVALVIPGIPAPGTGGYLSFSR